MTKRTHPIVIVGGRISGLLTAALLARDGHDVVVAERGTAGDPTISIALICPDTLACFDKIGFGAHLDSLRLTRIRSLSFEVLPGVRFEGLFPHSFGRSWGYAIRREVLDTLLQQFVVSKYRKVTWVGSFHIDSLLWRSGRVCGIEGSRPGGTRRRIEADLVIGADGKFSTVAKLAGASDLESIDLRTCFYYKYFQGATPTNGIGCLSTFHTSEPFPLVAFSQDAENGLIGVGIQASQRRFREVREDPDRLFAHCVRTFPLLRERLRGGEQASKTVGMLIPPLRKRQASGPGWALVGDAATHVNPITGQGISFAARSARYLADAIRDWHQGAREEDVLDSYGTRLLSEFDADFKRSAAVADIEAPTEQWRARCYAWMTRQPSCVDAWLRMLTNAISIKQFENEVRLSEAELRFRTGEKNNG